MKRSAWIQNKDHLIQMIQLSQTQSWFDEISPPPIPDFSSQGALPDSCKPVATSVRLFARTCITIHNICPFCQNAITPASSASMFCSCPYFRNEIGGEVEKQIALTRDTGKNWGIADDGSERSRHPCHTPRQVRVFSFSFPFLLLICFRLEASACWSTQRPTGSPGSARTAASLPNRSSRGRTQGQHTSATSSTERSTRTGSEWMRRWDQWRSPSGT